MMRLIPFIFMILFCITCCLTVQFSYADTEQMNATLARISLILKQINPLINEAQQEQDKNARIQFQFDRLRRDIAKIREGISEQLNHISIEPRQVDSLQGDYLSSENKDQAE